MSTLKIDQSSDESSDLDIIEIDNSPESDDDNINQDSSNKPKPKLDKFVKPPGWFLRQNKTADVQLNAHEKKISFPGLIEELLQPHQLEGIHFLWKRINNQKENHRGCVLAHEMGLGKTIQAITVCTSFIKMNMLKSNNNFSKKPCKILIVCPVNAILNWCKEFLKWHPDLDRHDWGNYKVFNLRGIMKKGDEDLNQFDDGEDFSNLSPASYKAAMIDKWSKTKHPSILILGYDCLRLLLTGKKKIESCRKPLTEVDLVICDEAHKIKDEKAQVSIVLNQIKTKRRIGLTGYPLQNNLSEYFCLINWCRPDYLGKKSDFVKYFEEPIKAGRTADATSQERDIMNQRTYVLRQRIKDVVHRRGHNCLDQSIRTDKSEFVVPIRLTPLQKRMYNEMIRYMTDKAIQEKERDLKNGKRSSPTAGSSKAESKRLRTRDLDFLGDLSMSDSSSSDDEEALKGNPLEIFSLCIKIINHPYILLNEYDENP